MATSIPARRDGRAVAGRFVGGAVAALILVGGITGWVEIVDQLAAAEADHTVHAILATWRHTFVDWRLCAVVAVIAVLERRYPAGPGSGLFTVGAAQDALYFVLYFVFQLTIVRAYFVVLGGASDLLPHANLDSALGATGALIVAFVVGDFLNWVSHLVRHRVPAFWRVHEVHHSQRSLNAFAGMRQHFAEAMIASTIVLVPTVLLGIPVGEATILVTMTIFANYIVHSNIRTNLGPLRHVFVTPQSHRVHHSIEFEHRDTNFGGVLVIWDRLFGTQVRDFDVYPDTGVTNDQFPLEVSARPTKLAKTYARQIMYPFRIVRDR
jgi:sterol desaturase/sphingolipid hydroxylase (fatty acid hydroxylase superfamily)